MEHPVFMWGCKSLYQELDETPEFRGHVTETHESYYTYVQCYFELVVQHYRVADMDNSGRKCGIRNSTPEIRNPTPETRNPKHKTRNPRPKTQNPTPETRNPKPGIRNMKHKI